MIKINIYFPHGKGRDRQSVAYHCQPLYVGHPRSATPCLPQGPPLYVRHCMSATLSPPRHQDRRIKLSQSFFKKILPTDSCLHTLLPPERNNEISSKLRNPHTQYHTLELKKYKSFLDYAFANFQNSMWFVFYCTFYFSYCELLIVYFISCVFIVS